MRWNSHWNKLSLNNHINNHFVGCIRNKVSYMHKCKLFFISSLSYLLYDILLIAWVLILHFILRKSLFNNVKPFLLLGTQPMIFRGKKIFWGGGAIWMWLELQPVKKIPFQILFCTKRQPVKTSSFRIWPSFEKDGKVIRIFGLDNWARNFFTKFDSILQNQGIFLCLSGLAVESKRHSWNQKKKTEC